MSVASRLRSASFLRFIVLGALNTLATGILFIVLMLRLPYAAAYVGSFLVGVLINALLVAPFVFRLPVRRRVSVGIGVWSLLVMIGGATLAGYCEQRGLGVLETAAVVASIILPCNFVGSRLIVRRLGGSAAPDLPQGRSLEV